MTAALEPITVYDYGHRKMPLPEPVKMEVDAWCVAGKTGIIAYFMFEGMLHEAHGDDGHWWLINKFSLGWVKELQEVVASITVSKKDERLDRKRKSLFRKRRA